MDQTHLQSDVLLLLREGHDGEKMRRKVAGRRTKGRSLAAGADQSSVFARRMKLFPKKGGKPLNPLVKIIILTIDLGGFYCNAPM